MCSVLLLIEFIENLYTTQVKNKIMLWKSEEE